jgi:REP element-mobilizing transposase RayT
MNYLTQKMQAKDFKYKGHRNSYTELNEVYFWTITVNQWQHLLKADESKMIIINSLQWLVQKELDKIYGYVIMPNHIHLMWEQLAMNGKEFPKNSFEKFTAKTLVANMKAHNDVELKNYAVKASDREHNIWLRDPLAIKIFNKEMAAQKLDYIHLNPMQPHWLLCTNPADYRFSSAIFYEQNVNEFGLLTHFGEVF